MASKTQLLLSVAPGLVVSSRYWYRRLRGRADPEMRILESLVRPGSIAVDVGGNLGDYTYALARHAREVVTFEPLPECAAVIRSARLANVTLHPVALSAAPGSMALHIPLKEDGEEDPGQASVIRPPRPHRSIEVGLRTLDSYELRDVSVLKIDVEGHEQAVIEGAEGTLRRERPVMLVEIEQRHLAVPIDVVFDGIRRLGYRGYFLEEEGRTRGLDDFSEPIHQRPYLHQDSHPAYVNDFFFLHESDPRRAAFEG